MNAKNLPPNTDDSPPQALEQSGVMPVRRPPARAREPQPSILPDLPAEPVRRRGRPKGSRNKFSDPALRRDVAPENLPHGKGKWDRSQTTHERQEGQRARLLEAAIALLDAAGLSGLQVDAVAEAATMGRQSFYLHFEGRAELLFAMHLELVEDCFGRPDDARAGAAAEDRLFAALEAVVRYAIAYPARARFALFEAPAISAPHAAIVRTYFDALASSLVLASLQRGLHHAVSMGTARMVLHAFRGMLGDALFDGAPNASLIQEFRVFTERQLTK